MRIIGTRRNDHLIGTNEDDEIEGGDGHDVLLGGAGNDFLDGGEGNDHLVGGDGNDHLVGHNGNNRLEGGDGDDRLYGGHGGTVLHGGNGDDYVHIHRENRIADGGAGTDNLVLYFSGTGGDVVFTLADNLSGTVRVGETQITGFESVEFYGGSGNDTITGGALNDRLFGFGGGRDVLYGLGGNDEMIGGRGAEMYGGDGNDHITVVRGAAIADAGDGRDVGRFDFKESRVGVSFAISDNLVRTVQVDGTQIRGFERISFEAGSGNDRITGGAFDDFIVGGSGDDILRGEGGGDELHGGRGNDVLSGEDGDDRLYGGDGNDELYGGLGLDHLDGGSGRDFASIDRSSATESIHFSVHDASVMQILDNGTTVVDVERAQFFSGSAEDWLTGGRFDDVLDGGGGNDHLDGGDGDDHLSGGDGNDIIYGGGGNNTIEGGAGNDTILSGGGRATIRAGDGDDLIIFGERSSFVDGEAGVDTARVAFESVARDLDFSVAANLAGRVRLGSTEVRGFERVHFESGSGNDRIIGGGFNDIIEGGAGRDTLYGQGGNDDLNGGRHDDVLSGDDGNDTLLGEAGNDDLFGGSGDDLLNGGSEYDYFRGDAGNDSIVGGSGTDTAAYSGRLSDYLVEGIGSGNIRITDLRGGAPDGVDVVNGVERFEFTDRTVGLLELLITASNRPPVAGADSITTNEDAGMIQLQLLANDHDPEGQRLTIVSVDSSGMAGRVVLNPDGTVFYAPPAHMQSLNSGQTATENFTYTVRDLFGRTATATATLTVQGRNDTPVAADDTATVSTNGSVTIAPLANDHDPDAGDALSLAAIVPEPGTLGRAVAGDNNTVTYTAGDAFRYLGQGQVAIDRFGYRVGDGSGSVDSGMVAVTVMGVNDAPVANGENFTVAKSGTSLLGNLLANDSDIDRGDTIRISEAMVTTERGATVTIDALGRATYDPGSIFDGVGETADSFSYTVVDSHGATSTATVALDVRSGSGTPDAKLTFREPVNEDESAVDLYEIISERLGAGTTIESVNTAGTLGTVTFDTDTHQLVFTADHPSHDILTGDRSATTSFTFTVRTPSGELRTGEMIMTVHGVNDPMVAVNDSVAVEEGQAIDLWHVLPANDLDPDYSVFHFLDVGTEGTLGRVEFDWSTGTLRYCADTPELLALDPGETIIDSFTYTITDGAVEDASTGTVSVTVTGIVQDLLLL